MSAPLATVETPPGNSRKTTCDDVLSQSVNEYSPAMTRPQLTSGASKSRKLALVVTAALDTGLTGRSGEHMANEHNRCAKTVELPY
jgi:hypothetical protein